MLGLLNAQNLSSQFEEARSEEQELQVEEKACFSGSQLLAQVGIVSTEKLGLRGEREGLSASPCALKWSREQSRESIDLLKFMISLSRWELKVLPQSRSLNMPTICCTDTCSGQTMFSRARLEKMGLSQTFTLPWTSPTSSPVRTGSPPLILLSWENPCSACTISSTAWDSSMTPKSMSLFSMSSPQTLSYQLRVKLPGPCLSRTQPQIPATAGGNSLRRLSSGQTDQNSAWESKTEVSQQRWLVNLWLRIELNQSVAMTVQSSGRTPSFCWTGTKRCGSGQYCQRGGLTLCPEDIHSILIQRAIKILYYFYLPITQFHYLHNQKSAAEYCIDYMKVELLEDELKHLAMAGYKLNLEERVQLKLALLKLKNATKHEQLCFWGRVAGVTKNYYIALGLNYSGSFQFPHKTFYWASADYEFKEMPPLNPFHTVQINSIKLPFSGDPNKVLISVQVEGENEGGAGGDETKPEGEPGDQPKKKEEDEENQPKPKPKNLIQLQRLAATVLAIQNDCALVPIGSIMLTTKHQVQPNPSFRGLALDQLAQLKNYLHFRAAQTESLKNKLKQDSIIFSSNFLERLSEDSLKVSWIIQKDLRGEAVSIRSLRWLGFLGYHEQGTIAHGYVYLGEGLLNSQLPFMM